MADNFLAARDFMLQTIISETRQTARLTGREQLDPRVLAAMQEIPRHIFVPPERQDWAYDNSPLPIGQGQTISQPFIVALMSDMLNPQPDHVVLEIGTGCGYQSAILAHLVKQVYSVERIAALADRAAQHLRALAIDNVEIRVDDGHHGWPEHAPFDGIMVTAAAARVPPVLLQQLKPGGRLVIPVGLLHGPQNLQLICKDENNRIHADSLLPVAFVPLLGDYDAGNPG